MVRMFRNRTPDDWDTDEGRDTASLLLKMIDAYNGHFIYSHEGLTEPFFYYSDDPPHALAVNPEAFPAATHLAKLQKILGPEVVIKLVVTIRNQAD
jgi:hypothetical protein